MLIGKATRFIVGRNAVQTVYWRTSGNQNKLIRYKKTCQFIKPEKPNHTIIPTTLTDIISISKT